MQKFMQIKEYLLELSFLALLIKILIVGAGIGEALVAISLASSIAYKMWLAKSKIEQFQELTDSIGTKANQTEVAELKLLMETLDSRLQSVTFDKSIKRTTVNEQENTAVPGIKRRIF